MLRITKFCEKCNEEVVFSSVWAGENFHCQKGHTKVFEPAIGHCIKCKAEIEFDAATATYIMPNDKREVVCPWDLCQECDP